MLIKMQVSCIVFLFLFQIKNFTLSFENLLCTEKFCKDYLEKHKCDKLGAACRIQNETYNGKIFPAPLPCNCCQTCIQYLNEGEICSVGGIGKPITNLMCGPGLICAPNEKVPEDYRCKKMEHTNCLKAQNKYDKQKNSTNGVGTLIQRPICDDEGHYTSVKCNLGQMCFCVNKDGKRIFGEAPYHPSIERTMKCECSRLNENFNKFMNYNSEYLLPTARCLEDGSYDPMQCSDNNICNCVKKDTGIPRYWTSFNSTSKTYDKIPCFNNTIHSKFIYLHNCEKMQWDIFKQLKESEESGYLALNFEIPSCQQDGWFLPLQQNETALFCVDKYGRIIDNFEIAKTSNESKNMNCKCARTRNILIQNLGRKRNKHILPQCCPNGNFKKIQCRDDVCYCSDEDGLQIGIEKHVTNMTSLECYNEGQLC